MNQKTKLMLAIACIAVCFFPAAVQGYGPNQSRKEEHFKAHKGMRTPLDKKAKVPSWLDTGHKYCKSPLVICAVGILCLGFFVVEGNALINTVISHIHNLFDSSQSVLPTLPLPPASASIKPQFTPEMAARITTKLLESPELSRFVQEKQLDQELTRLARVYEAFNYKVSELERASNFSGQFYNFLAILFQHRNLSWAQYRVFQNEQGWKEALFKPDNNSSLMFMISGMVRVFENLEQVVGRGRELQGAAAANQLDTAAVEKLLNTPQLYTALANFYSYLSGLLPEVISHPRYHALLDEVFIPVDPKYLDIDVVAAEAHLLGSYLKDHRIRALLTSITSFYSQVSELETSLIKELLKDKQLMELITASIREVTTLS